MLEDIMCGEETEILGIREAFSMEQDAVFVLPGTHNKVVKMLADDHSAYGEKWYG